MKPSVTGEIELAAVWRDHSTRSFEISQQDLSSDSPFRSFTNSFWINSSAQLQATLRHAQSSVVVMMERGPMTHGGVDPDRSLISMQNAVLCIDCEVVSTSSNDKCPVCSSRSLFSLFRMLGGTLSDRKTEFREERGEAVKYDLEITLKIKEMTARDLNDAITSINRLTMPGRGCRLESFHINVDSYVESGKQSRTKAA